MKSISTIYLLLLVSAMISCKSQPKSHIASDPIENYYIEFVDSIPDKKTILDQIDFDTIILWKNIKYRIYVDNLSDEKTALFSITKNEKLILRDTLNSQSILDVELVDFNHDGNKDIQVHHYGKNSWASLYLFNLKSSTFDKIVDFEKFTDIKPIQSENQYFYSYARAGCADMNWYSYLIKIENHKAIPIALIKGNGCPPRVDSEKMNIPIFKISNGDENSKKLIKELPYDGTLRPYEDKWDYLEKYWNENFRVFL